MTAPVSSSIFTYLASGSTLSITQASGSLVNSVSPSKSPSLISNSPYIYQGIPLGQQIFLANTPQNGFVIAQPSGASYMITHPQPQFQVRTPSGSSTIPMALVLGPQPPSGLIQLPQQSATANVIPAINPPIVCVNPSVAIQSNLSPSLFSQTHPGVAVARFPNGCSIAPNNIPNSASIAVSTIATPVLVTTTTATAMNSTPVVTASAVLTGSALTRPTIATPESVLLELNKEIGNLERLAVTSTIPLTLQQSNRLRRLLQARDQVLRTIENAKYRPFGAVIRSCTSTLANAILRPRPPCATTSVTPLSSVSTTQSRLWSSIVSRSTSFLTSIQPRISNPDGQRCLLRSDVISLLVKHRLLPMHIAISAGESVLVEFRLSSQRYQLWLTRAQKVDLEQMLYSLPTNQRKSEVLVVYQQEQTRFFAAHPRPAPSVATQLQLLRSPLPSQSQSISQQPWVSQRTVQSSRQPIPTGTMCVLAPVPASVVTTPSDLSKSNLSQKMPLFIQTSGVDVSASSFSSVKVVTAESPIFPINQLSLQQSRRLNAIRSLLHADQIAAVSRLPVMAKDKDRPLPTLDELLSLLAPYHIHQDLDNTPEAIDKVDEILDKAFCQLFTRKRQTEDAVHSILFSEKWQLMGCPEIDHLTLSRVALENDRERFEGERAAFEKLKARLDAMGECHPLPPKQMRQFLKDAVSDFVPLEFDEKGNSQPATLQFNEGQSNLKVEEVEASMGVDSLKSSAEECAWQEWEEEIDFRQPSSPEVDIANVFVEEEETVVNKFDVSESRSPLNGLSMGFHAVSASTISGVEKIKMETVAGVVYKHLQHSEDPTIDAAIRSIIDL